MGLFELRNDLCTSSHSGVWHCDDDSASVEVEERKKRIGRERESPTFEISVALLGLQAALCLGGSRQKETRAGDAKSPRCRRLPLTLLAHAQSAADGRDAKALQPLQPYDMK